MRRAPAALLLAVALALAIPRLAAASPSPLAPHRHGVAILFLVGGAPFDRVLAVPEFRALARAGGAALMTTRTGGEDPSSSGYLTIGAGALVPDGGTPHLLATYLRANGVRVCLFEAGRGDRLGRDLVAGTGGRPACDLGTGSVGQAAGLAGRIGGDAVLVVDAPAPAAGPAELGAAVRMTVGSMGATRALAMVVAPRPSVAMVRAGDAVTALVVAEGPPSSLFPASGPVHALTSATTRQAGLVANIDVAPTLAAFFGLPAPPQMDGSPIRVTAAPAPFGLYRRQVEQRRIRLPIQVAEVTFVSVTGILGIAAGIWLTAAGSVPNWAGASIRYLALCAAALPIPVLAGGLLPRFTYGAVVPFIVLVVLGLATAALATRRLGATWPFTFLGLVGLALVVAGGLSGGAMFRIPLVGGTMFDGVRFYGLTNPFTLVLVASAVFVAARLPPAAGFLLLIAAGLFAGLPALGADLGGSVVAFFAAGLWWPLRARPRFGWLEGAVVPGVTILGTLTVLLANRYLPGMPTHVTRFVEGAGGHAGLAGTLARRIGVSIRQLLAHPEGFVPLLGLPVLLTLVLVQPWPVRRGIALDPTWRDVLVVVIVASLVGFAVNDTGVSAAAPGFLYAMCALAYPVFLAAREAVRRGGTGQGP